MENQCLFKHKHSRWWISVNSIRNCRTQQLGNLYFTSFSLNAWPTSLFHLANSYKLQEKGGRKSEVGGRKRRGLSTFSDGRGGSRLGAEGEWEMMSPDRKPDSLVLLLPAAALVLQISVVAAAWAYGRRSAVGNEDLGCSTAGRRNTWPYIHVTLPLLRFFQADADAPWLASIRRMGCAAMVHMDVLVRLSLFRKPRSIRGIFILN